LQALREELRDFFRQGQDRQEARVPEPLRHEVANLSLIFLQGHRRAPLARAAAPGDRCGATSRPDNRRPAPFNRPCPKSHSDKEVRTPTARFQFPAILSGREKAEKNRRKNPGWSTERTSWWRPVWDARQAGAFRRAAS